MTEPRPNDERARDTEAPAIEIRGVSKSYAERRVLDDVDLTVEPGEVYGLLGRNGAGKTTLMRVLLGLVHADAGEVSIQGCPVQPHPTRALAGVAGFVEAPRFYPYLSVRRNLSLLARLDAPGSRGRIDAVIEEVGLTDRASTRARELSYGMVQRLGLAAALMRDPTLLVLDEPTNGLDPAGIRDLRVLIATLAARGVTVLLSSHQMAEVDAVCSRVAIMRVGEMAFDGSLADLRRRAGLAARRLDTTDNARALTLAGTAGVEHPVRGPDGLDFEADDATVARLSRAVVTAGIDILTLHTASSALETLFFRLTDSPTNSPTDPPAASPTDAEGAA